MYQSLHGVELHDVWPSQQDASRRWIERCRDSGWKAHLLVVPRRGGDLEQVGEGLPEDFSRWLCGLALDGHPLWLHGLTHSDGNGGDAEFRRLDGEQIRQRLDLGRRDWNMAGLPGFEGFCPPCWKACGQLPGEVAQAGIALTANRWGWRDAEGFHLAPAVSSWGPGLVGRIWDLTLCIQVAILERLRIRWRLVLHPQDLGRPSGRRLGKILERAGRS
jgi:predicted deacetylase